MCGLLLDKILQLVDADNLCVSGGDENSKIINVSWSYEFRKMLGYYDTLDFPNKLEAW